MFAGKGEPMLKVLIVEDEDIIRRGLVYTIDWLAMDCMVIGDAADGKAGLALIERHQPDLVITDIIMPEMGGIEMLEEAAILEAPPFKSIILTSYSEFEYARQAVRLQVADYLLKPVDEEELKKTIEKLKRSMEADKAYSSIAALTKNGAVDELVDWDLYLNSDVLKNTYVTQAIYKIRDHYNEKIGIESIAEEFKISASYLSRKFKETTAQTFSELLTRYRIQKAIALLKKGTYRVYEVSELTGFSDYKHFCSVFKKYTQTSPTEFMKTTGCIIHK